MTNMDKQKKWMANKDFASIREYNCWKAKNWRIKNNKPKIEIQLTDLKKKKRETSKKWYLDNREYILAEYHKNKNISTEEEYPGQYTWLNVSLEDRNFVHNFNPNDYPGYKKVLNNLIKSYST